MSIFNFKKKEDVIINNIDDIQKLGYKVAYYNNTIYCGEYGDCKSIKIYLDIKRIVSSHNLTFDDIKAINKIIECLEENKLQELKGSNGAIPPEVIGTNGEDGGLFDYGDR